MKKSAHQSRKAWVVNAECGRELIKFLITQHAIPFNVKADVGIAAFQF